MLHPEGPAGSCAGLPSMPEEPKRSLSMAVYYDKTGFTRSLRFIGRYGNNLYKRKKKGKRNARSSSYLFWSKYACTDISLPGLINRTEQAPSTPREFFSLGLKIQFSPYQPWSLLHSSYSSLWRRQMQGGMLQHIAVTTSANKPMSGAFYC